jgi:hypothetical protein
VVKFRELEPNEKVVSLSKPPSILMGIMDEKIVSYTPTIHPHHMMDEKVVSYPPIIHPSQVGWMNK